MKDMHQFAEDFLDLIGKYNSVAGIWEEENEKKIKEKQELARKYYDEIRRMFDTLSVDEMVEFKDILAEREGNIWREGFRDNYAQLYGAINMSNEIVPELMFDAMHDKLVYHAEVGNNEKNAIDSDNTHNKISKIFESFNRNQARRFAEVLNERREQFEKMSDLSLLMRNLEICDELESMLLAFNQDVYVEKEVVKLSSSAKKSFTDEILY